MNPQERAEYDNVCRRAEDMLVPGHLIPGIGLYIVKGIEGGGFLNAALENNLSEAMASGDEQSLAGLRRLVAFFYNEIPSAAWGSKEKVAAWRQSKCS